MPVIITLNRQLCHLNLVDIILIHWWLWKRGASPCVLETRDFSPHHQGMSSGFKSSYKLYLQVVVGAWHHIPTHRIFWDIPISKTDKHVFRKVSRCCSFQVMPVARTQGKTEISTLRQHCRTWLQSYQKTTMRRCGCPWLGQWLVWQDWSSHRTFSCAIKPDVLQMMRHCS